MVALTTFYSLTNAQKSIWNIVKFYPKTTYVNLAIKVRIRECVDYKLLNRAINIVIQDNDAMRTRIVENGKEPEQYFAEYREEQFELLDFSYPEGLNDLTIWEKSKISEKIILFDSNLYQIVMLKTCDNEGAIFIKIHHIAADTWCLTLLVPQILENYSKLRDNKECILEERPSYINYIQTENELNHSERFLKHKAFWDNMFSTVPDFTTFNSGMVPKHMTAERKIYNLSSSLTMQITEYSRLNNVSPFCILFSALSMCIWKLTSKTDLVIGTPILNRSGVKEKNTMGMFVNTIPFRISLIPGLDFDSTVKEINRLWKSLLKHQKYPYDAILKNYRETHDVGNNLFDISLSFQNAKFEVDDIDYNVEWLPYDSEVNSLTIHINDREDIGNYIIDYVYLTEVFSEADINRLHEYFSTLLNHALSNPNLRLADIKMLSTEQEHDLVWKFNDTRYDYPKEETIVSLFEKQVSFAPDKVAVIFENVAITYHELNNRSNQLAKCLQTNGVKKDSIVGLLVDRSVELIIAILAVLKAGGAYLPIDPTYPAERIDYFLKDSNCQLLLIYTVERNFNLAFEGSKLNLKEMNICRDTTPNLEDIPSPSDLAYVIYTSGSTGNPKGVMVEHKGVINFVHSLSKLVITATTSLSIATVSFDLFFVETMFPLLKGMCVILANKEEALVPYLLLELIDRYKVNFVLGTPSRMKLIMNDSRAYVLHDVTEFFIGGEKFPELLLDELEQVTNARIIDGYGPTETSICATIKDISGQPRPLTIGRPIENTQIYILDQWLNLVPIGVTGEIFISGVGLARGYINNEELTREKFIPNPFIPGSKMYKTGDIARWQSNREIEIIGRNDYQVKIRGLRIELGEIENCLVKHDSVNEAVVLCNEDENQKKYLCAYITRSGEVSSSDLHEYLSSALPDYMIPAHFVVLDSLPLTPSAKVNRRALPKPDIRGKHERAYVEPRNELEQKLAKLWEGALEISNIGIDDDFFALGGDSLAVLEVLSGLFPNDWGLSAQDFYDYSTIRRLADKILGHGMQVAPSQKDDQVLKTYSLVPECQFQPINSGDILLTGATGFLGIHILYELLNTTNDKIYCLIRGSNPEKRLLQLLNYYFPVLSPKRLNDRLIVINGDVSQENLGLSSSDLEELGQAVTRVIHTAAMVSHYGEYNDFYCINVKGTQEIVKFCRENGKKLNHISTMSVSGNYMIYDQEMRKFTEQDFYIGQDYHANVYVRTKFEAEDLILKALDQGLNATIFRVGVLTGRYSDGQFQTNIGQNAFYRQLKAILMLEAVPFDFLQEHMEFTPIDYCAKAIVQLTQSDNKSMPIFHVYNHKTVNVGEMLQFFEALGVSINAVSQKSFDSLLLSISTTDYGKEILSGIISNLNINDTIGSVSNIQVDSSQTIKYLNDIGFEWPDIHDDYISKVIGHMQVAGFLEKVRLA